MAAAPSCCRFGLVMLAAAVGWSLTGCSAGDGLKEYRNTEGRFRILLPGTPTQDRGPDLPSAVRSFRLELPSGEYTVAWEDLNLDGPKLTADRRLNSACDKAVADLKGKTLSREEIALDETYPGRELVVEGPRDRRVIRDRMYLVDSRLYHVMASGGRWWVSSATTTKVLDSFQLIEK